jgi:hypothetical protein
VPSSYDRSGERIARYLAAAVASIFIALGVAAAVAPDAAIAISRQMVSPLGIYGAAALRCGLGIALLFIARTSRAQAILRVMGVALLLAGLTFPIFGVDSAKARIEWEAGHMTFLRLEGVLFAWAGLVVYKLAKSREAEFSLPSSNTSLDQTPEG